MEKFSSYVKFAVLALALVVLAVFGFVAKKTQDEISVAKNELRSASVSSEAPRGDMRANRTGGNASGSDAILAAKAQEFAVSEAIRALGAASGLAVDVREQAVSCIDISCLENYDGILRYLNLLSNLPMKLEYKSFCLGPDCGEVRGFGFEYNVLK